MITRRQALEFLAAHGCVRGAAEVIVQAAVSIDVTEAAERIEIVSIQRLAAQQWRPQIDELTELLGCDDDITLKFIAAYQQPDCLQRLEKAFQLAFESVGGIRAAFAGQSPDPTAVIATTIRLFVNE